MSPVQSVTHVSGMDLIERIGAKGFEPSTARTPSVCATRLRYAPMRLGYENGARVYQIPGILCFFLRRRSGFFLKKSRQPEGVVLEQSEPEPDESIQNIHDQNLVRL